MLDKETIYNSWKTQGWDDKTAMFKANRNEPFISMKDGEKFVVIQENNQYKWIKLEEAKI